MPAVQPPTAPPYRSVSERLSDRLDRVETVVGLLGNNDQVLLQKITALEGRVGTLDDRCRALHADDEHFMLALSDDVGRLKARPYPRTMWQRLRWLMRG